MVVAWGQREYESLMDLWSSLAQTDVKALRDDLNSAHCRESCESHRLHLILHFCARTLKRWKNWKVSFSLSLSPVFGVWMFSFRRPVHTVPYSSGPEAHKPVEVEEKLRRPIFSASLSSPSPRSNPTRRRPIKHDSWVGHTLSSQLIGWNG